MASRNSGPQVLKAWRESQAPTVPQRAVGEWLGVSASRISHYETELEDLPIQHKVELSKRTGIPLRMLLNHDQAETLENALGMFGDAA